MVSGLWHILTSYLALRHGGKKEVTVSQDLAVVVIFHIAIYRHTLDKPKGNNTVFPLQSSLFSQLDTLVI